MSEEAKNALGGACGVMVAGLLTCAIALNWPDGLSTGDNMPATILTAIIQNKPALARIGEGGGSANQIIVHVFDSNDPSEDSDVSWIWIKPEAIVSLSYVPPKPLRKIDTPRPATLHVTGLQYGIEITDDGGVRGFKAGCNTVKNPEAIKVLEHLAAGLGYTVAINPKATMKPQKVTKKAKPIA